MDSNDGLRQHVLFDSESHSDLRDRSSSSSIQLARSRLVTFAFVSDKPTAIVQLGEVVVDIGCIALTSWDVATQFGNADWMPIKLKQKNRLFLEWVLRNGNISTRKQTKLLTFRII